MIDDGLIWDSKYRIPANRMRRIDVSRGKYVHAGRVIGGALLGAVGAFVAVIGEAGLGKSRLLAEVSESAKSGPQVAWLEGRALSYEQAVTYYPWRQVIHGAVS